MAAFLRENPPADVEQKRFHGVLDSVETPWSRREENQLREVWQEEFASGKDKSMALIERVEEIGVEPFEPPDPLPPIEEDEVHLVCWMGIMASGKEAEHWATPEQVSFKPDEQLGLTEP